MSNDTLLLDSQMKLMVAVAVAVIAADEVGCHCTGTSWQAHWKCHFLYYYSITYLWATHGKITGTARALQQEYLQSP